MMAKRVLRVFLAWGLVLTLLLNGGTVAHAAVSHGGVDMCHQHHASGDHDPSDDHDHKSHAPDCCGGPGCNCACASLITGGDYRLNVAILSPARDSLPIVSHYHSITGPLLLRPPRY